MRTQGAGYWWKKYRARAQNFKYSRVRAGPGSKKTCTRSSLLADATRFTLD